MGSFTAYFERLTDAGPPVIRGGAADVSPWQDCGEWLLALSAGRGPQDMFTSVRPAIGPWAAGSTRNA